MSYSDPREKKMGGKSKLRDSGKTKLVIASLGVAAFVVLLIVLGIYRPPSSTVSNSTQVSGSVAPQPSIGAETTGDKSAKVCTYSTSQVTSYVANVDRFYKRTLNWGNTNFLYTCDFVNDWTLEYSKIGVFPLSSNPDYQEAVALRNAALAIKASSKVSTLEKIQTDMTLSDVDYYVNLTAIDHFVNQLGTYNYDYGWVNDRVISAGEMLDTLVEDPVWGWCNGLTTEWKTANPATFDANVLTWLSNLAPMMTDYKAAFEHQLAQNKTHAAVTMDYQGWVYTEFTGRDFTAVCSVLTNPANAATCITRANAVNAALLAFKTYFFNTYVPATPACRPNSAPGIVNVAQGKEAYQIMLNYHLGFVDTPQNVYDLGTTMVASTRAAMLAVGNLIDTYATFADLSAGLGNTSDSRYYFCNASQADVIAHYYGISGRINSYVHNSGEFGYGPRVTGSIGITGSPSTYMSAGSYDPTRNMWLRSYYFNIGDVADDPEPYGCDAVYDKTFALSTIMHESFPGHGLQISLMNEVACQFSRFAFPPTSFTEGWALYVETLGYTFGKDDDHPKGLYTDPIDELGFFMGAMLRMNRMQEDPALSGYVPSITPWTFDHGWQSMAANGFTEGYSKSETERYITMPGQATAYMRGRLKIEALRTYAKTNLGAGFDPREFHNMLTRFGGATFANLESIIQTYVYVKNSVLPATDKSFDAFYGIDLVRQMFAKTIPYVGLVAV